MSTIRKAWDTNIAPEDLVLMPGDISDFQEREDVRYSMLWINDRTGTKVLSPGNHDSEQIWHDEEELEKLFSEFDTLTPLRNSVAIMEHPENPHQRLIVAGVRGSQAPGDKYFNTNKGFSTHGKDPEAVRFLSELMHLKHTLDQANSVRENGDELVLLYHYCPFANGKYETAFSKLIEQSGVTLCVYGHLHQKEQWRAAFQGERNGVHYRFVGADFLKFAPTLIAEWTPEGLDIFPVQFVAKKEWPTREEIEAMRKKQKEWEKARTPRTDKEGNALICHQCDMPITENQSGHMSKDGPVHGKGMIFNTNTCKYMDSDAGRCIECKDIIWKGQPFHKTAAGLIHGRGNHDETGTCKAPPLLQSLAELEIQNEESEQEEQLLQAAELLLETEMDEVGIGETGEGDEG